MGDLLHCKFLSKKKVGLLLHRKFLRKRRMGILLVVIVFILIDFLGPAPAYGYSEKEISKKDIQNFVDGLVSKQLEEYHIGGAGVAVVKDGEILFTKGYGYEDAVKGQLANVDTVFRVGSITKLFTWTAVMQLVEEGKLDLHKDVNQYLRDFKVPENFKEPVTLQNLMAHTAGFEDKLSNLFMIQNGEIPPLRDVLMKENRQRIYEPGKIIAYSKYGAALAGYIVHEVSGMEYKEYIEKNILNPLDMQHSTLKQPVEKRLESNTAMGHIFTKNRFNTYGDPFVELVPAGAMSVSANDIAKFMIAHLQIGRYKDKVILKENTAKEMHSQQFTSDRRLPGICYGFMEWNRNHKRIIWHSGGSGLFKSLLMLIPEENVGVFISYNSPNTD